jgi:hypothetical protein
MVLAQHNRYKRYDAKRIVAELFFASEGKKSGSGKPDPQGFAQEKNIKPTIKFYCINDGCNTTSKPATFLQLLA